MVLYARKDCTEQLRKLHGMSIVKLETSTVDGVFEVMAYAKSKDREDVDFGAVSIKGLPVTCWSMRSSRRLRRPSDG